MKLLTLNFLTCARKTCKSSPAAFPLHPQEAELEQIELDLNPLFIKNILPRLDWTAMKTVANEVREFFFSFFEPHFCWGGYCIYIYICVYVYEYADAVDSWDYRIYRLKYPRLRR